MVETPEEAAVVRRCQATIVLALSGPCDDARIAELVADLSALPPDHPERARLAAGMLMALFRGGRSEAVESVRHLAELLRIADGDPPFDPQWTQVRSLARTLSLAYAGMNGQLSDLRVIDTELASLAETVGDRPQAKPVLDAMRMMAEFMRAMEESNESALLRMPAELAKYADELEEHPEVASLLSSAAHAGQMFAANQQGNHAEMWEHLELLQGKLENLPAGDLLREAVADASTRMKPFRQLFAESHPVGGSGSEEPIEELLKLANRPGATDHDRALNHLALGNAFLAGGRETDLARVESGIEHFRKALQVTPPGHSQHAFRLLSVALGLFRRSEVAGTTDGLDEATRLLERARELLGGPNHPHWALTNEMLAAIRHRNGDVRAAGEDGFAAQSSYAWRALLESDAAGTKIAIRDAARGAVDLARRCLRADNPADALRALDSCRGLMLFAATELHKVPARLDAAGRPDLARRWELEGSGAGDLRREALTLLAESPDTVQSLLDPPSLNEIRAALAALDADALVYLVPAELPLPGLAVIAPVDGPVGWMALPNLTVGEDTDVDRYLAALADRSRDLAAPADSQFVDSLAALCDWAWGAAIGPLLERYFGSRPQRSDGQVPRIVLIPMGDLARIPWQAARRGDGVYAVELGAFSHAVSARLLCDNAARPPLALSSSGLIVGDPDTGGAARVLDAARLEAHAIRQAFYQGARYVGRRPNGTVSPSGSGTADDVRRWLADGGPAAGVMLHLACHGSFTAGPDDAKSALLLAPAEPGGSGAGELTAEEILDLLAAARRPVGLVVLAACNTGRSIHGYDEAYSLGTAFLAGTARSVLSTQWSIPDAQTSSLMYLFHHYCRNDGLPPWQALRQAQMWMLDPGRRTPERMPAELLRAVPAGEPASVVAWAGFVHYGQ